MNACDHCSCFCEDTFVLTFHTFRNSKPWFAPNLRKLCQENEEASRSGYRIQYKMARNTLTKEIRVALRSCSEKLQYRFSAHDPASVERGWKKITNYRRPSPEKASSWLMTSIGTTLDLKRKLSHLIRTRTKDSLYLKPTPHPSRNPWRHSRSARRMCSDSPSYRKPWRLLDLMGCLHPVWEPVLNNWHRIFFIFDSSMELCEMPFCFKWSTIIPVPTKPSIIGQNDCKLIALTSVIIKTSSQTVLQCGAVFSRNPPGIAIFKCFLLFFSLSPVFT